MRPEQILTYSTYLLCLLINILQPSLLFARRTMMGKKKKNFWWHVVHSMSHDLLCVVEQAAVPGDPLNALRKGL